jgi:hypothetical protein
MNKETAILTVKQWYTKAAEPSLSGLLEMFSIFDSGVRFYRPYIVAALMMRSEQKTLIKADVATWEINRSAFINLMNMQSIADQLSGLDIPDTISVPAIIDENVASDYNIGITLI